MNDESTISSERAMGCESAKGANMSYTGLAKDIRTLVRERAHRDIVRELRDIAGDLQRREARTLVDWYYQVQEYRKRADNQLLAQELGDVAALPFVTWMGASVTTLEADLKHMLEDFAAADPVGQWAMSVRGVGPVISAGLLAHIDIARAPTVGSIWRFAGLDPSLTWCAEHEAKALVAEVLGDREVTREHIAAAAARLNRSPQSLLNLWPTDKDTGERKPLTRDNFVSAVKTRPYNGRLKTLCWKIGESFVKQSGRDDDVYGHLYLSRKQYEHERNDAGELEVQAVAMLRRNPNHAQAAIYRQGRLPDGHLHSRAKRWAVKLFLSHWHEVAYWEHYGEPPPKPYVFTVGDGDHAHRLRPPNWSPPLKADRKEKD
ncbi:MAG: transposase [Armatimonadota bacterium]|nr:transposase [Armatimonadota bacterium]